MLNKKQRVITHIIILCLALIFIFPPTFKMSITGTHNIERRGARSNDLGMWCDVKYSMEYKFISNIDNDGSKIDSSFLLAEIFSLAVVGFLLLLLVSDRKRNI